MGDPSLRTETPQPIILKYWILKIIMRKILIHNLIHSFIRSIKMKVRTIKVSWKLIVTLCSTFNLLFFLDLDTSIGIELTFPTLPLWWLTHTAHIELPFPLVLVINTCNACLTDSCKTSKIFTNNATTSAIPILLVYLTSQVVFWYCIQYQVVILIIKIVIVSLMHRAFRNAKTTYL